jgi:hypothetical protein
MAEERPKPDGRGPCVSLKTTHQVRVGDELLEADKIFINVGDAPPPPPLPGFDQVSYLNNSTMMEVDFVPEHLIVVGGATWVWSSLRCTAASAAKSRSWRWGRG